MLFAIGIARGRLVSCQINGETGALTPLAGQCPCGLRLKGDDVEIGAAIFFTDYSMAPADLVVALEQRGFDSLYLRKIVSCTPATRLRLGCC